MSKKRSILLAVLLVMVMVIATAIPVAAATTATVTVTAVPAYVTISTDNTTWAIDGLTGDSRILTDTAYYSNPLGDTTSPSATVLDTECYNTITNGSNININVAASMIDFSGGDTMTNSGTTSNGATTFAAYVCESGAAYSSKVNMLTSGTGAFWTSSSAGDDIKVVFEVETRSDPWDSASTMTSTITLTATAS
jgi:hypothetical protein